MVSVRPCSTIRPGSPASAVPPSSSETSSAYVPRNSRYPTATNPSAPVNGATCSSTETPCSGGRGGRQVGSAEDDPVDGQRDLEWRIAAYERGFRRAGVPNRAERYSAAEEIFTRAWPFLTFVLLLEVSLTQELLRTATGVTCFSALYYAVAMTVDATYQDEFVTRIIAEMRQTCADHAEYLKLIAERNRQPISAPS
jgi:hypothetical protein